MKRSVINSWLIMLLLSCVACKDDFLDVADPNSLTANNFPTTMAHLEQMLNGVYANQHAFGLFGHNMLGKNTYMWDHTGDLAWLGTPTWISMGQNNTLPNDGFVFETWRDTWKGVQRANTLLNSIDIYRTTLAQPSDLQSLSHMEAQAYFLRAWFYYYLVNFWGESFIINGQGGESLGMPIITEVANNLSRTQVPRATVRETWNFIIDDLKRAEALLENHQWTGNNIYKADIWAVKGFLGKAYTFTEDWTNAQAYLGDVITNSGKSLVPFEVYKDMFNGKNQFNSESVFEINMNVDMNTWGAWGDQSMGSSIGMVISPCFTNNDGGSSASGWGNVFPHENNLRRFGFTEPSYFRPGTTQISPDNVDPAYVQRSLQIREQKLADPRLWVSMLQPYVDSMQAEGRRRAIAHYHDGVELTMQAWSFRKYVNLEGTEYDVNVNNGSNFYWLRLADVYLLYAETLLRTGNEAGALEYINKVKRRAYGYPPDTPSPVDYPSLNAPTLAPDPVLANDPLKYERWAELFGEGSWWMDVQRWRIGDQEASFYQRIRGGPIMWTPASYAQPIPRQELESNTAMRQNPGYN
jgi:starch-binding outer membrane protein, SusD/RagB family